VGGAGLDALHVPQGESPTVSAHQLCREAVFFRGLDNLGFVVDGGDNECLGEWFCGILKQEEDLVLFVKNCDGSFLLRSTLQGTNKQNLES
jgi:hypothetical protein